MIKLEYKLVQPGYTDHRYNILQIKPGAPYQFFAKDTLIGSVEKVNGKWEQTSGRQTLDSIVEGMGKFIETHTALK